MTSCNIYDQHSKIHYNPVLVPVVQQLRFPLGHALHIPDDTVLMLLYHKIPFKANPQYELQSLLENNALCQMNPTQLQSRL